jgi:hypothetical protein
VFENSVLRRMFGPRRDEVTEVWRKVNNEELRDLYFVPSIIRIIKSMRIKWADYVERMGRQGTRIRKPEERRPVGRHRLRWMDNIEMDLGEIGWSSVDFIGLTQDRDKWSALVNAIMNLWVP